MSVRPGPMRHELRLEQQYTTQDAAGGSVGAWRKFACLRCAVQATPGAEVWASATRNERAPMVFRIRYWEGITPDMRIIHNGRRYNIKGIVDQGGLHEELVISAVDEGAAP